MPKVTGEFPILHDGSRGHRVDARRYPWFRDATRLTYEVFPSRAAALKEEARLIWGKQPLYNEQGQRKRWRVVLTPDDTHDPGCVVPLIEAHRLIAPGDRF